MLKMVPNKAAAEVQPEAWALSPAHPQARRDALHPGWATLRILLRRERSPGRGASWRAWGRVGVMEAFFSVLSITRCHPVSPPTCSATTVAEGD